MKNIEIVITDGVGLRNFAFTDFYKIGVEQGFSINFWNLTSFDLNTLDFQEFKIESPKLNPFTDLYKQAQTQVELNLNSQKAKDLVYNSYRFPLPYSNFKSALKSILVRGIVSLNNSQKGLERIKNNINNCERKTKSYNDSFNKLKKDKPEIVFCTNQRTTMAISLILAARDLKIPTACFIVSWDNLPKGNKFVETDFYFVWSDHMKRELLYYYPEINESSVFVTGTPQFECHYDRSVLISKEAFFNEYKLDLSKKYICFSGDDFTTSPNDEWYLNDVAEAVKILNNKGYNLGIVFRRCPVDFSNRYDEIIERHQGVIVCIDPKWKRIGEAWNTILPTKDDMTLLMNTIHHTELVINLGSSMVFDYIAFHKPCAFLNYNIPNNKFTDWSVEKIYNLIHFRSMPNQNSVFWLSNSDEIAHKIEIMLENEKYVIMESTKQWYEKINQHEPQKASERIWDAIQSILKKEF
jgi:hypothetical protein